MKLHGVDNLVIVFKVIMYNVIWLLMIILCDIDVAVIILSASLVKCLIVDLEELWLFDNNYVFFTNFKCYYVLTKASKGLKKNEGKHCLSFFC